MFYPITLKNLLHDAIDIGFFRNFGDKTNYDLVNNYMPGYQEHEESPGQLDLRGSPSF
jgi:hypothetical protein